jgi:hypothetical protein
MINLLAEFVIFDDYLGALDTLYFHYLKCFKVASSLLFKSMYFLVEPFGEKR